MAAPTTVRPRGYRVIAVAAVAMVAVVIAAIALGASGRSSSPAQPASDPVPVPAPVTVPVPRAPVEPPPAPAPSTPTPVAPAPSVLATVEVEVRTTPSGADIVIDGQRRGVTPARLTVAASTSILLRRAGYRSARVLAERAGPIDVRLIRRPRTTHDDGGRETLD